jgi:hypothetical protein
VSSESSKQAIKSSPLPSKKLNYAAAVKGSLSGLSVSLGEDTMDRIIDSGVPIKEILAAREEASKSDSSDSDVQEVFDETAARSAKKKVPESNDPFDSSPSGDEDSSIEVVSPPIKNREPVNRESSSTPINWEECASEDLQEKALLLKPKPLDFSPVPASQNANSKVKAIASLDLEQCLDRSNPQAHPDRSVYRCLSSQPPTPQIQQQVKV